MDTLTVRKEVVEFVRACERLFYSLQVQPQLTEPESHMIAEYLSHLSRDKRLPRTEVKRPPNQNGHTKRNTNC